MTVVKGDFEITAKELTITINGSSDTKEYNGLDQTSETTVTPECSDAGFDANKFSYTGATTITQKDAGTYTSLIDIKSASYSDSNYAVTFVAGTPVTFTIDPKPVTITVNDASKVYGEADPEFTGTVEGILNKGDLGTISYVRTNTEEDVGTYEKVLDATYTENSNYTVTVVKGDFEITAKELTIHVKGAEMTVPYNGAEQKLGNSLQFTVVGELPNGVNVEQKAKVVQAAKGTNVGTYDQNLTVENLVVKGEAASNYQVTIIVDSKGGLTITPAPLTITAASATKQYDGTPLTAPTATADGLQGEDKLDSVTVTGTITDIVPGQASSSVPNVPSAAKIVNADGDDVTGNYTITYVNGTLTIATVVYTINYVFDWPGGAAPAGAPAVPAAATVARHGNYTVSTATYADIPFGIAPNGNVITVLRFQGWDPSGTITNVQSNRTITGAWTIQMVWYTVTYTDGVPGQVIFPDQVTTTLRIGANTPAFNGTPTREGYTFTGWAPAVSPTVTGNNVYTAQWAPIEEERIVEPTPEPTPVVEEEIVDEEVPQAAPAAAWALINLLAALGTVATAVGMIITFFKKKDDDDDGTKANPDEEDENKGKKSKFLGLIPAVASVVIFILTENMHNPMALVDKWTIPMVLILAANGIVAYLTRNKKPEDEDTEKAAG